MRSARHHGDAAGRSVAAALRIAAAATLFSLCLAVPSLAADEPVQTEASRAQVAKLLDKMGEHYAKASTLSERRDAFEQLMQKTPGPSRVQIKEVDAGGVGAELIWPARLHYSLGKRAILYVHGGGFYSGSLDTHRASAASFAKAASADVLLIDYRLAPEYPYPSQIDDTLTAYLWLLDSGYESSNIVMLGDSVGGNLAIEAVLRQIKLRGPPPAAVITISAVTDLAATGASIKTNAANDPFGNALQIETARKAYLGDRSPTDPRVSPLYADMKGFPPLLMQVGSKEISLDDTLRLADKAKEAGVDVTTEVLPGMIHQWQLFPFWLDDARKSNQRAAEFALQHFADKPRQ
ncbi:alpha/beta hydrolase [Rhizobium sp. 2MFCol3.1]|uniref:alpha/beta hydrolase n=1 Tax=Rhizobium sp. 2MFCol3.1 TaxID=1246459 RepID=UPI00037AAB79|nr:alpha/beta hydrolase [Rhizobium sp. 2MFCol3.1]